MLKAVNRYHIFNDGTGVAKDEVEAMKWFRKAAEQNDAGAEYNLGVCYNNGDGVAKDYLESYKWWLLAAAQLEGSSIYQRELAGKRELRG